MFRRSKKRAGHRGAESAHEETQLYRIDFDMMLKGNICKRNKTLIRQYGVTVNGSTRLVTSGEVVDRDTYRALLAAGAVVPAYPDIAGNKRQSSVDFTTIEPFED